MGRRERRDVAMGSNENGRYMFVYQEWDVLREKQTIVEERLERVTSQPAPLRTNTFAPQLQEARIAHRMTIAELAEKCGVNVRTMSLFEAGSEMPSTEMQAAILSVLGVESG